MKTKVDYLALAKHCIYYFNGNCHRDFILINEDEDESVYELVSGSFLELDICSFYPFLKHFRVRIFFHRKTRLLSVTVHYKVSGRKKDCYHTINLTHDGSWNHFWHF